MQHLNAVISDRHPGYALGLKQDQAWRERIRVGEYQNNDYIRRLNHQLYAELSAAQLYQTFMKMDDSVSLYEAAFRRHRIASKTLIRLILCHQGIPGNDSFSFTTTLTQAAVQVSRFIPPWLGNRTTHATLEQIEKLLLHRYDTLVGKAPYTDKGQLLRLYDQTKMNLQHLATNNSDQQI